MHGLGFFFIGYLSSIFAEQAGKQRGQIEVQKKNIGRLEELNRVVIENLDFGLITLDYEDQSGASIRPERKSWAGFRGIEKPAPHRPIFRYGIRFWVLRALP